jgi:hypothetical protein
VEADAVFEESGANRNIMAGGSIGLMGRRPPIVMATSEPEGKKAARDVGSRASNGGMVVVLSAVTPTCVVAVHVN